VSLIAKSKNNTKIKVIFILIVKLYRWNYINTCSEIERVTFTVTMIHCDNQNDNYNQFQNSTGNLTVGLSFNNYLYI